MSLPIIFLLAICWLFLAVVSSNGGAGLAKCARLFVVAPIIFTAIFAVRGLMYSNCLQALSALFVPKMGALANPKLWAQALGQMLLSLSLAGGVMPSFANSMPKNNGVCLAALTIVISNLLGCIASSLVMFTSLYGCGLWDKVTANGIITTFCVYPSALVKLFKNPIASGIFATLFYLSLLFVALQSALSLLSPLVCSLAFALKKPLKFASAIVCLVGFALSLPFATGIGRYALTICDGLCCLYNAPIIACAQTLVFALSLSDKKSIAPNICLNERIFYGCKQPVKCLITLSIKYLCPAIILPITALSLAQLPHPLALLSVVATVPILLVLCKKLRQRIIVTLSPIKKSPPKRG